MRKEARIAWGLWGAAFFLLLPGMLLLYLSARVYQPGDLIQATIQSPLQLIVPALGALIVTRRPGNVIGWLFCILGALAFLEITSNFAVYAIAIHPMAGATWSAWFGNILPFPLQFSVLTFPFLVFPDGKLLSRRWWPVVWLTVGFVLAVAIHEATVPSTIEVLGPNVATPNPVRLPFMASLFHSLTPLELVVAPVVLSAPVAALVIRYRRARTGSQVRQQIKLITFVPIISAACFLLSDPSLYGTSWTGTVVSDTFWYLFNVGITLGLPIAVVIAILRHGLWDIDRIINRTLVYASLTASLAGVYILGVLGLQYVLSPITRRSDLAIALTTLAVAGLFQPVRQRIQAIVDRRFFRQRYDAQRVLARFGVTVRDEVDLERLTGAIALAIDEAMQPAHVSVSLYEHETR